MASDGLHFVETLGLPAGADAAAADSPAFRKLLDLTAVVLGVSYFKLQGAVRDRRAQYRADRGRAGLCHRRL